ncbi:hypothetical protein ACEN88_33500 [Massilia sp. CT11-108]|uniref:hypothetical protein n=1 Tax=Massilia sp. CT11-108 TaxID=3393900 RepID=UPI0039A40FA8
MKNTTDTGYEIAKWIGGAAAHGAHREFLVAGHAELAHEQDVEGDAEPLCDGEPDRDAAARQCQHDGVRMPGMGGEPLRQQPARFGAILEMTDVGHDAHAFRVLP